MSIKIIKITLHGLFSYRVAWKHWHYFISSIALFLHCCFTICYWFSDFIVHRTAFNMLMCHYRVFLHWTQQVLQPWVRQQCRRVRRPHLRELRRRLAAPYTSAATIKHISHFITDIFTKPFHCRHLQFCLRSLNILRLLQLLLLLTFRPFFQVKPGQLEFCGSPSFTCSWNCS